MNARARPWSGQKAWHVARWGPLGWAETTVKLAAIAIALLAAGRDGAWSLPAEHRLAWGALAFLTAGYVAAIADRWLDRELVAMAFVLAMVAGHAALLYATGREDWPADSVRSFAGLMLLGDLIKLGYFASTGARVRGMSPKIPLTMTAIVAVLYLVVLLAA